MIKEIKIGARTIPIQSLKMQESFGRMYDIQEEIESLKTQKATDKEICKY